MERRVAAGVAGVSILHAGTRREADGRIVSAGGRVLGVTAIGGDLAEARSTLTAARVETVAIAAAAAAAVAVC